MTQKILTAYWAKPIPRRDCDWSATYDDYEGGDGYSEPSGPIGFGATEQEAIDDLVENHPREEEPAPTRTPANEAKIISDLKAAMSGWRPIATLEQHDNVVLWNPCDGLNLLSYLATDFDIEQMRRGEIYTHWRVIEGPAP